MKPLRQQEDMPTPVDIVADCDPVEELGQGKGWLNGQEMEQEG